MAQKYGYKAIELFHEDLLDISASLSSEDTKEQLTNQLRAAQVIRQLCSARDISILCLQPFMHYEGLLDRQEHDRQIEKLLLWFQVAKALGTDIIQIPSSFLQPELVSSDFNLIVEDLRQLADLGLQQSPPIRYVYESLAWGTHTNTWEQCWAIVSKVDRPNFGICLDTFNIAARLVTDPTRDDCVRTDFSEKVLRESMQRLVSTIDVKKVFYVQIVDGQKLSEPISPTATPTATPHVRHPPVLRYSRGHRLFYGETEYGAYLPVRQIALAIFKGLGFEGWVSLELFNQRMEQCDEDVPEELARRGAVSWERLAADMEWTTTTTQRTHERVISSVPTTSTQSMRAAL